MVGIEKCQAMKMQHIYYLYIPTLPHKKSGYQGNDKHHENDDPRRWQRSVDHCIATEMYQASGRGKDMQVCEGFECCFPVLNGIKQRIEIGPLL
jgi:hypothetical protein